MPQVIKIKSGQLITLFDIRDTLDAVEDHMGNEMRCCLEEYLRDTAELETELKDLEKDHEEELERFGDHQRALLNDIREEAEALGSLLEANRLDRKKLRSAADNIWRICYQEL